VTHYCTYFDRNYLYKGLAMVRSLERHAGDFLLTILCMDGETRRVLESLGLEKVRLFDLQDLEAGDEDLAAAKRNRTAKEYCWTLTPSLPLFVLGKTPGADSVTYLDADLLFFSDPSPIYEEFGDRSILIIEHRFSPRYLPLRDPSGIYNVAFMTFRNDDRGMGALRWWRERCNEWCYCRMEDGKFGDQKYLDDWPERFDGVCVLQNPGANVAPWNIEGVDVTSSGEKTWVGGHEMIFFHYHGVHLRGPGIVELPRGYRVTTAERDLIYKPYVRRLRESIQEVGRVDRGFSFGIRRLGLRERAAGMFRNRFCRAEK
jgi:hypothetical protein